MWSVILSVGEAGVGGDGFGGYADRIARVVLFEDVGLTAVSALDARAGGAAEIKPAVSFESKFAGAFVEYLREQLILIHDCYGCLFCCASVAEAGTLESQQVVGGVISLTFTTGSLGCVEQHLGNSERAGVSV